MSLFSGLVITVRKQLKEALDSSSLKEGESVTLDTPNPHTTIAVYYGNSMAYARVIENGKVLAEHKSVFSEFGTPYSAFEDAFQRAFSKMAGTEYNPENFNTRQNSRYAKEYEAI